MRQEDRQSGDAGFSGACLACAAALLFALAAWASLQVAASVAWGLDWEQGVSAAVRPLQEGGWRLLRGGLAYLAIPALLLACIGAGYWALRSHRWADMWAACALVVGSNATIQAVKHAPLQSTGPLLPPERALSGHVAVGASTCLALLLLLPPRRRMGATLMGWGVLTGLSVAILLSRWHGLSQVLAPGFICGSWAVAVFGILTYVRARDPDQADSSLSRGSASPSAWLLTVGGLIAVALSLSLAFLGFETTSGTPFPQQLGAAFGMAAGAAALTLGVASLLLPPVVVPRSARLGG